MINLLFMLCVSWSGGEDCSYSWTVSNDMDSAGLYDPSTKTVYASPVRIAETITHEIKHIKCDLSYNDDRFLDITFCNYKVDLEYNKPTIPIKHAIPLPENKMSGKMINTLGLIGEVKDFSGNLKEDYNGLY